MNSKQVRFSEGGVLQQVNPNVTKQSSSKLSSAINELRTSFNNNTQRLTSSRASELNESVQTVTRSPGPQHMIQCSANVCCQPQQQQCCSQQQCNPQQQCYPQQAPAYVVGTPSQNDKKLEKKIKKLKKELRVSQEKNTQPVLSTISVTPKREKIQLERDPEIDRIKNELQDMDRMIRQLEARPVQSQQEIELYVDDNKKCLKKLCKKVKSLEKELYEVARQRDEALIIKQQLERENQDMFDRIGELESLLKLADKKVFDLTIQLERQKGYIQQLEDEVQRLRSKKQKTNVAPVVQHVQQQPQTIEKIIDRPVEVIKTVEKRVEVPVEVIKNVPYEVIKEKIVEVPRIEYVYQNVPQYIDRIVEVPVERIKEVLVDRIVEVPVDRPVYHDRIREVPVDRIVEVPYEVYRDVPYQVPYEVVREVPYEIIKEVPYEVRVPYEVIKEIQVPYEVIKEIRVPYEVIKEVPYEVIKERIVEVPRYIDVPYENRVETIKEVPIEMWHRDDREIHHLQNENSNLQHELQYLRDRLREEVEQNRHESVEQVEYLRSQIQVLEVAARNAQMDSLSWEDRTVKLESELTKERSRVTDLQNRLDQMYYQVETLTSENNKKNEDFARYLEKLEARHKKEIQRASQPQVVQHYLVDTGAEGHVQVQPR